MPIKDLGGMENVFKSYGANDWVKKAEVGEKINFADSLSSEKVDKASKSFGDFLRDSISEVNNLQQDANVAMEKLASGETKNLHETLIAVEKADIAFRTMNQVRMKVIDAYKEIMRMQV